MSIIEERQRIIDNIKQWAIEKKHSLETIDDLIVSCSEEIASAAKEGDLAENAAYTAAIEKLDAAVGDKNDLYKWVNTYDKMSKTFDDELVASNHIDVGTTVVLTDVEGTYTYMLVPEGMGNSAIGALSIASTVGEALISKSAGDSVTVRVDEGTIKYKVKEII